MTTTLDASLLDVLERTARGEGQFPELASALKGLDRMVLVMPPAEFARFMQDMERVRQEKEAKVARGELPASEMGVKITDVESPRLSGIQTEQGFVPRIFTDDTIAREYAVTAGLIEPDGNLPLQTKPWVSGLQSFLLEGCAGCVIDDGTDHKINLKRQTMARLFACMTLEEFARWPELYVVTFEGKVHYQRTPQGDVQVFAYDNARAAQYGVTRLQENAPGASTASVAPRRLLEEALGAGATMLVVNNFIADARFYDRDDLVKMIELLGGRAPEPPPPPERSGVDPALQADLATGGASPGASSAAEASVPELLRRALARPALPPVPPPAQDDVDAQMTFFEWKSKADGRSVEIWQFLEALAFEVKCYALVHPRPVDGLRWPQFFRSPDDEQKTITYLYTSKEVTERVLSTSEPDWRRYLPLSGLEALRWIWAAPRNIDTVAVDYYGDSPAWMTFPSFWGLSALFPTFYDVPHLKSVPPVALGRIGELPGARPLKPESVRAFALGWKTLFRLTGEGGAPAVVEHEGGRFLPVFSDADRFFAYSSAPGAKPGKPEPVSGAEPPFRSWLAESAAVDGVLLDPGSAHPLALGPADLLAIDLWSRRRARPEPSELVLAIGGLLAGGLVDEAMAGRLAADYPRYWVGFQQTPEGGGMLLMVPDTDACAVFTSHEAAKAFLTFYENVEAIRGMSPVPVLSRWSHSAFSLASGSFAEAWIDPDPMLGAPALRLGTPGLESALAWLDDKLKPRVPGFVWEG